MIVFGSWSPDAYDLNSPLAGEAKGVLPGANSYHPWASMVAASGVLPDACCGAFLARASSGQYNTYAGTTATIQKYATSSTWSDFSGATYAVPTDELWSATQFGTQVIFANGNDGLVVTDVDVGTAFAPLGGSPPVGRYVKAVGDFLFVGRTSNFPTGVEWSGLNDDTWWTHGQRSSDYQQFPDGGFVTGITSLEAGLIFQETAIRRFAQVTDRAVFNFAKVEDGQGAIAPNSIVTRGQTVFYLGRNGFRRIGPDSGYVSVPIGLEILDKWFQDNIELTRLYRVQGVADPLKPRVFFLAPSSGNSMSILDICLCYDDGLKKWTHADVSSSILIATATPGLSLDAADDFADDIDAVGAPTLDSPVYMGGVPYLGGFDSAFKLSFFNGPNMAATVQTAEFQPIPGKRTFVRGFRPITDAANVTGRLAGRESPQGTAAWKAAASVNAQGLIPQRISTRLLRAEVTIAAGETWSHCQGVDWNGDDMAPDGAR